jgi:hypothetical protein
VENLKNEQKDGKIVIFTAIFQEFFSISTRSDALKICII